MCGRFSRHHKPDEIAERFDVELIDFDFDPRYNIAPSQISPVIAFQSQRKMMAAKWGLVPFWAKDPAIGNKLINARAETLAEKPSFKNALAKRRCLIPADGFYEWQKKSKGPSQPYYVRLNGGGLFAFAGLWEAWKNPEGGMLQTFTIITTEPNELIKTFHHRMAVILKPEDEGAWIDPENSVNDVLPLLKPYPAEGMEAYMVSRAINSPSTDNEALIERISAE
ncbi:MAG: SOS response-associated peptidase [Acidobacteria bacterium]|nr:SOS response-associated peptidase [Acidobacteriota bacterium]